MQTDQFVFDINWKTDNHTSEESLYTCFKKQFTLPKMCAIFLPFRSYRGQQWTCGSSDEQTKLVNDTDKQVTNSSAIEAELGGLKVLY